MFNQPVANGMVLIVGMVVAVMLASDRAEPTWRRALLWLYLLPSALAIYLTHTRSNYLAFVLVLILGVILASGARAVFAGLLVAIALLVGSNWSTFTSSDRAAGGMGSKGEVWDRLNAIATSIWAFKREPWFGWGISRFPAVNFYDHQQWSNDFPWSRGLGLASHETELGILGSWASWPAAVAVCTRPPHRSPAAGVPDSAVLRADRPAPRLRRHLRHGHPDRIRHVCGHAAARFPDLHAVLDLRNRRGGPSPGSWPRANPDRHCGWLPRLSCPDHAVPGRAATRPSAVPVEVP